MVEALHRRAYTAAMRLLICLLLAWPLLCSAEMYRWVDGKGHVHYSQVKPTGQNASTVAPAAPATAPVPRLGLAEYASRIDKENAASEKARAEADGQRQLRTATCNRARGELKFRKDYEGRTFTFNERGEREYPSAQQSAQVQQQLETAIAQNCGE